MPADEAMLLTPDTMPVRLSASCAPQSGDIPLPPLQTHGVLTPRHLQSEPLLHGLQYIQIEMAPVHPTKMVPFHLITDCCSDPSH